MAGYFDSSLLVAAVLRQGNSDVCAGIWDSEQVRLSSILLKVECVISVRRIAAAQGNGPNGDWAAQRLRALDVYIESISYRSLDQAIERTIRQESRLSACRALDAVHLATAMYFQPHLQEPLSICSLDKRLRDVARCLGFKVLPAELP